VIEDDPLPSQAIPSCMQPATPFDSNGKCHTYAAGEKNGDMCTVNKDGDFLAQDVCQECGKCIIFND